MAVKFEDEGTQRREGEENEEEQPPEPGSLQKVKTAPVKRQRWATQRQTGASGINKRRSILDRFHRRQASTKSISSDGTLQKNSDGTDESSEQSQNEEQSSRRTVYFNSPLPPEALDEEGRPVARYVRNKIRTARYTALSFIPKDLYYQFQNIANIYFLFIVLLSIDPIFGVTDPALNAVPLIVIVTITAIRDAVEDTRRTLLDSEVNNAPVRRLMDWQNVNSSNEKVSVWRKFKKANTRAVTSSWKAIYGMFNKNKDVDDDPITAYAERAQGTRDVRPSTDSRRISQFSNRLSEDGVEMTPVTSPSRMSGGPWPGDVSDYQNGYANKRSSLQVPGAGNRQSWEPPKRDFGNILDRSKEVTGKAKFQKDSWKNVKVGDFIRLYNDEEVPADMIVLSTSDADGACYIETKNLDGETNLKVRQALRCSRKVKRAKDCEQADFKIESEGPTPNLYSYSGVAKWNQKNPKGPQAETEERAEPITINNMVLRGCGLRNTEWIVGVVVFTGQETKIMLNSGITPSKRAKISRDLNWNVIYNFIILFCMCLVAALVEGFYWGESNTSVDYFEYGAYGSTAALNGFITFWAAVILFQNLVPISLYISLEIVRTIQAFFIYSDTYMYYDVVDYPCTPKAWNICDDLGQIEYVFSDKTGTLTQNVMEFKKATINGVPYGEAYTEALAGMQKRQGIDTEAEGEKAKSQIARDKVRMLQSLREVHDNPYLYDENVTFVAPDYVTDIQGQSGSAQEAANKRFMLALALCHTVITERTPGNPPKIEFKAQSPDEAALVATARDCGFTVIGRTGDGIIVNCLGEEKEFTVLNTLEFNSTRKRMSAIVRMPDGKIMLFCKGADSMIYSRLKPGEQRQLRDSTAEQLEMFAREGLRTLCIAQKEIPEAEYQRWNKDHDRAAESVDNREEKLEEVSSAIEQDLELIGGTAIEDRLQDGVPDAISLLGNAGVKLWVLTGDKVETAINIGFSCNLLNNDLDLIQFTIEDDSLDTAERLLDEKLAIFGIQGTDAELKAARKRHEPPPPKYAIVIDGDSLRLMLDERLRLKFLLLCKECKSVLCCRVSPAQKAAVVRMVKLGLQVMTLSIGDGANDVAMIQEADVGVGIAGLEGRQAVMSADFAFGQFRFLARLMLVHGRWNYRRMAETISNFFYKNIVWTFCLFWYQIYDNFDCSYVFDYTYVLLYNLAFTSLAVIFMGILDQDVSDKVSLAVPQLYRRGIERKEWTPIKFWMYMFDGLYQSLVCFFMPYLLFEPATFNTEVGRTVNDNREIGVYIAHATVIIVNLYILLNTYRWDWFMLFIAGLSVLFIFGWTGIYTSFTSSFQFYGAASECYAQLTFWAQTLLVIIIALIPRFVAKAYQKIYMPRDIDIIREQVIQGKFKYLDDVDPNRVAVVAEKPALSGSSSESSGNNGKTQYVQDDDRRPMYPPSTAPTNTTRNPHSTQGSDDTTATPRPLSNHMSFDRPRISLDKPTRPSFDRMRSSMDQLRPSFEQTRGDMTSASWLTQVESRHSNAASRDHSRLRDETR